MKLPSGWIFIPRMKDRTTLEVETKELIRCHECKHFEYDHPYVIQGVPVLGHEVCNVWGNGCKTDENGWCFLAERANDGR